MADSDRLRVYTDGACSGNPGPGGWAWASSRDHAASGGEAETTNNRMELTAVLRAITDNPGPLTVVMDSTYVKNGLESWSKSWVRNGWKTKAGQPVKNRDLWEQLLELEKRHEVEWAWTKGHAGHSENETVDRMALAARRTRRGTAD